MALMRIRLLQEGEVAGSAQEALYKLHEAEVPVRAQVGARMLC
jgi:hypothetical protein